MKKKNAIAGAQIIVLAVATKMNASALKNANADQNVGANQSANAVRIANAKKKQPNKKVLRSAGLF